MKAALSGVVNWFGAFGEGEAAPKPPARPQRRALPREAAAPEPDPNPPGVWTPARMRLTNALWGEGFVDPGGEEEALRLSKPLGLQPSHSVLNIGAGMGGAARAITTAWGAWVSAYEQDPALAEAGEALSKKAKLEKKAEIRAFDPHAPKFRANYYHHALVQEALWTVERKDALLAALAAAVKPGGQVVFTDLTLGDVPFDPDDQAAQRWMALDRSPAHPIGAEAETALLAAHGFDIRIAEEISPRHARQAVAGWKAIIPVLQAEPPTPAQAKLVVQEAELWLRRLALVRSGRLRLMRWHAIRR